MNPELHPGFCAFMEQVRLLAMLDNPDTISTRTAEVQDQIDESTDAIALMIYAVKVKRIQRYAPDPERGTHLPKSDSTTLVIGFESPDGRWKLEAAVTAAQREVQSPDDLPWVFGFAAEHVDTTPIPSEWTQMITHALDPWTYEALR